MNKLNPEVDKFIRNAGQWQEEFENLRTVCALTPGRQRAYLLYFSSAKQAKTREARVEKYTQQILDGKGLND